MLNPEQFVEVARNVAHVFLSAGIDAQTENSDMQVDMKTLKGELKQAREYFLALEDDEQPFDDLRPNPETVAAAAKEEAEAQAKYEAAKDALRKAKSGHVAAKSGKTAEFVAAEKMLWNARMFALNGDASAKVPSDWPFYTLTSSRPVWAPPPHDHEYHLGQDGKSRCRICGAGQRGKKKGSGGGRPKGSKNHKPALELPVEDLAGV